MGSEIENLKARAAEAGASARIKYETGCGGNCRRSRKDARKLDELRSSGSDAWQDLKVRVEQTSLKRIEKAISRFAA
ncbi:MAG: hypothetical protein R3D29_03270 [Nitratireductor sp.]